MSAFKIYPASTYVFSLNDNNQYKNIMWKTANAQSEEGGDVAMQLRAQPVDGRVRESANIYMDEPSSPRIQSGLCLTLKTISQFSRSMPP
jgi:hypothetical protein